MARPRIRERLKRSIMTTKITHELDSYVILVNVIRVILILYDRVNKTKEEKGKHTTDMSKEGTL